MALSEHKLFKPVVGTGLAVLCGLVLWGMPLGERWVNASYDYLFRFPTRPVTNQVVLVLMDKASCRALGQKLTDWDRRYHAELLNKLTDGKCPLVVFDIIFASQRRPETDAALAEAMRRHGRVVLMARVTEPQHPMLESAQIETPHQLFLDAARNQGIGKTSVNIGETPRRHWPFPASGEGEFLSLPWVAAKLAGARFSADPQEQWLRYYGEHGAWEALSYHYALAKPPNYFRDKIVFIGSSPQDTDPNLPEEDKFRTPYTRWPGGRDEAVGGVEIMATTFLNLVNGDWLRRPAWWIEIAELVFLGALLGGGLSFVRPLTAFGLGTGAAVGITLASVWLSQVTNYWFPWLVIVGGQVPCAVAWAVLGPKTRTAIAPPTKTVAVPKAESPTETVVVSSPPAQELPEAPDYELFERPFGEGAYGKVWLARNAIGQWQALKAVYLAKFAQQTHPFEREFTGIRKYKPVSDKHPGLLRVDFVSRHEDKGYFYYVMELGDAMEPGWEDNPAKYVPRDLARVRAQAPGRHLPVRECLRIGLVLAEALDFLHRQGLTHRDIKPQNIIFVRGQPKLADVGLVADVLLAGQDRTWVGTPGYMPPPPEPPGTPKADIYGLGMVLYVILTGHDPQLFPELATTLTDRTNPAEFMRLNSVILKACQPDLNQRYATAGEMAAALQHIQAVLECEIPAQ